MKSSIKRILAMVMVFAMMIGMMPNMQLTAHAAGEVITEAELFEQIEFTNAMINGSPIVNSNSSAFTKTNGDGWELKYSQSGTWLYFDLYLDNANINQVNFIGKLRKDSAYSVQFNVHVKGNCSISGLYVEISHTDPKYQFGGEMASYSNLDANIIYDSHNSTLDASNFIQIKGLYNVRLRVDNNGYTGDTLKCNYVNVEGTNWLSRIDMHGVNFIAKPDSGSTGVVFNVYNCGIYLTNCNVLFNLPESMRPFQDGNNKIEFYDEMVEYGGKVERIHEGVPGAEADYVDSNRYAAILSNENLAKYLKFTNQNPAMPSGNTETDIAAILGNTETYQFNNAALPNWLAEGGFDVYRSWEHSKDGSTIVGNGNSADDLMTYSYNYTNSGNYKFVEELTLKYFDKNVSGAKKTNTFNITTKQAPKFTTQPTSGEVNVGEKHTVTWATDFTPVKQYLRVYNADDTYDYSIPLEASANSYTLSPSEKYYHIRAYYGEGANDYIDSDKIVVTETEGGDEVTVEITKESLKAGKVDTFYMDYITSTPAGNTVTLVSGTLPAGIDLQENGNVIGTPEEAGTFKFTVKVAAMDGEEELDSATKEYTLVIEEEVIVEITKESLKAGKVDTFYMDYITSTPAGNTVTLVSGTLPAGIDLQENGNVVGTPEEAGTFTFTVKATAPGGEYATKQYTLVIEGDGSGEGGEDEVIVEITKESLKAGKVDTFYMDYITSTPAGNTVTLVSGTLPAGIDLQENGNVVGTPEEAGTFTFTVKATAPGGEYATKQYTLVIEGDGSGEGGETPECTHENMTLVYEDGTGHWSECTAEGCEYATEKVPHVFKTDEDTTCECGYTRTIETPECKHENMTLVYEDGTGHWSECTAEGCEYATEKVPHVFEDDADTTCECGYTRTITPPTGDDNDKPSGDKDDVIKPSDKEDKPEADKAPQTGDDSNMFMWFAAMILAGITGLGIFRKRRAE